MEKGITIAGNIVLDRNKYIDRYPEEGALVHIKRTESNFGGCVCNTAANLSQIQRQNIHAVGVVGSDSEGHTVFDFFSKYEINSEQVSIINGQNTSTVDVYVNEIKHKRTFFANLDVNHLFGSSHIACKTAYFHIGYVLLLPYLDAVEDGAPRLAKLLKRIQEQGVNTSIDLVTDESDRYQQVVVPTLKYVNYLIINEIEAQRISGVNVFTKNKLDVEKLKKAAIKIKALGVNDLVVIHAPEMGLIYDGNTFEMVNSLVLPNDFIKSSVGAGDGFCAGVLHGIMHGYSYDKTLRLASCVAAGVLNSDTPQAVINGEHNFFSLENIYERGTTC